MVISGTGVLLYAKVSPLYNVLLECHCYCLHVNYNVKHLNTWVHIGPSKSKCFLYISTSVFEVLRETGKKRFN